MKNTGEYGFKVLRGFKTDKLYKAGDDVMAEEAKGIPVRSRLALSNTGKVEFFSEPAGVDALIAEIEALKAENEVLKQKINVREANAEGKTKAPAKRGPKPKGAA